MGFWWLLMVAMVWEASVGETPPDPAQVNTSMPHQPTKRGVSWTDDTYKQTKRAPKFSSWGGKRSQVTDKQAACLTDISQILINECTFPNFQCLVDKLSERSGPCDDDSKRSEMISKLKKYYEEYLDQMSPNIEKQMSIWGEKEDSIPMQIQEKRAKFSNWGGKRTMYRLTNRPNRRTKFSSWGGKRSDKDFDEVNSLDSGGVSVENSTENELVPLNYFDDYELETNKRAKFSNWGGKRNYEELYSDWNPLQEEKRSKFSSWGGKRSDDPENGEWSDDLEMQSDHLPINLWIKRAKFSSWGGKRSDSFDADRLGKKAKFSSWGGKRDYKQTPDWSPNPQDKRVKFSSWGGKRSDNTLLDDWLQEKRAKFSSWGGKRSDGPKIDDLLRDEQEKRAKFQSWGGKRWDHSPIEEWLNNQQDKRAKFSSWGGKRSDDFQLNNNWFDEPEDKRAKFNSWGGKRNDKFLIDELLEKPTEKRAKFSNWGGKRSPQEIPLYAILSGPKRAKFSSWGGKRSEALTNPLAADLKRAKFSSWGGKRNVQPDYIINSSESDVTEKAPINPQNRLLIPEISPTQEGGSEGATSRYPVHHTLLSSLAGMRSSAPLGMSENHSVTKKSVQNLKNQSTFREWFTKLHNIFTQAHGINKNNVNRIVSRRVFKDGSWTTVLRPIRRGSDFYSWGGK